MIATRLTLAAIGLALTSSGFILMKRSRSPYAGVPMDAQAIATHRRGEKLSLAGNIAFLIFLLLGR